MTAQSTAERKTLIARPQERQQALDLLEQLGGQVEALTVEVPNRRRASVPPELADLIGQVLEAMASGGTVTIGALPDELTTTVAAEQLAISRPTLMKLIREGQIPAHKVGSHNRVKTSDVLAFKRQRLERQRKALEDLRALEDELDADAL